MTAASTTAQTSVPVTQLSVTLSDTFKTTLSQDGVSLYAVFFNDGTRHMITLADKGQVTDNGQVDITLTETVNGTFKGLNAGKVYFLLQSQDPANAVDLTTVINSESEINWGSAETYDYRFDSFEVTLLNGPDDKGNLTSINGFGIPMHLSAAGESAGYKVSGADMFTKIADTTGQTVQTFSAGPLAGTPREAISPSVAVAENDSSFSADSWDPYIDALKTMSGIEVAGFFNGSPDAVQGQYGGIWHNAGFYAYTLEWDEDREVFWLSPTDTSQIKGHIQFTKEDLANSIYSTLGDVGVYETKTGDPYQILDHVTINNSAGDPATMNSGENNQWGAVLAQFITGFTGGYYGVKGQSLNGQITTPIDLNKNWNWDPTYAFGKNLSGDGPTFQDTFSEVFFAESNSYGSGYSDALMQQYSVGGPLLSMSDSSGQNVSTIDLTLFDDSEVPSGYVPPEIYNYIPAGANGYTVPAATSTNSVGLNLANATVTADDSTAITLSVLTSDASDKPVWQEVEFTPGTGESVWQNWSMSVSDGVWSATPAGGASLPGQLLITNFPGAQAGVYWSQLTIGAGDTGKTFNLYTTVDADGKFVNPAVEGQGRAVSIDGLATIAPENTGADPAPSIETFGINFLYSTTTTVDPANLVYNTQAAVPQPAAPVVGTLAGSTFHALTGQTALQSNTVTSDSTELAFSWVGGNDDPNTRAWISGYTNKIGALNFAQIHIEPKSGKASTIHTSADLDGQWQTDALHLGNDTYTITMKEYEESDTTLANQIGQTSQPLHLTVNVAEAGLRAWRGEELALDASGGTLPAANWLNLEVVDAGEAVAGSLVVAYLVDRDGRPADSATGESGDGVSVEDATVATLGAHQLADGTPTILGAQFVHLPSDLRLAFATLDGAGMLDTDAHVRVRAGDDGTAGIRIGGFTLSAQTDNTLSPEAMLASGQRFTGEPLVYLEEGSSILVEGAGSSPILNSVGFARVDLHAGTTEWTIGGVAPGEAGFDRTVRAALEVDSIVRGRGDFTTAEVWTVAGGDGFYAPVLLNHAGDIVVGPAAGSDVFRALGDNTYVFEDRAGDSRRDFDDIVVRLSPLYDAAGPILSGGVYAPQLAVESAGIESGTRFASTFDDDDAFTETDFGLTLTGGAPNAPARLVVGGLAIFRGDSDGVLIDGGPARVRILEDGQLIRRDVDGEGAILTAETDGAPVDLRNEGVVRGAVTLGTGDDVVWGGGVFDGPVDLGAGADRMTYSGAADLSDVRLGAGDDGFVAKGTGAVVVHGGQGADWIAAGHGSAVLFGGGGDDVLFGGSADDTLAGNRGADRFVIDLDNGDDLIRDFEAGADVIDLRALDLRPAEGEALLATATSAAGANAVLLDLAPLGGNGTVLIRGIADTLEPEDVLF